MRKGGGKKKGASFEREICKALSLWVTNGKRGDVFWRSAMSGGRATIFADVRQCGDICAVAPEGAPLVERFFIECKHYKDLQIANWALTGKGHLADFWEETKEQAEIHNCSTRIDRRPLLIFRQNGFPIMLACLAERHQELGLLPPPTAVIGDASLYRFEDWLKLKYKNQPWQR